MNKIVRQLCKIITITILVLSEFLDICYGNINYSVSHKDDLQLSAISAVVIDASNNRMLYGKNPYDKRAMASTTKIMTCILALEQANLEDVVKVSKYAASMPKVKCGIKEGECYILEDLVYGLMLESYNDVAVAIAEHIAGNVEEFAKMMNIKANEIGMTNTNFVTPNGLDDKNHYSTAYDMALLGSYAIKNEKFIEIINTKQHTISQIGGNRTKECFNRDSFLNLMEGAIGIKTGFTGKAGYCFVGAVKKNNSTLISVVLGSGWPPQKNMKWTDTKSLMEYALVNYEYKQLINKSWKRDIEVEAGTKNKVETSGECNYECLISEMDNVNFEVEIKRKLVAPIQKGEIVGKIKIVINDKVEKEFEIVTEEEIKRKDYIYCLGLLFNLLKLNL